MSSQSQKWVRSNAENAGLVITEEGLSNGTCDVDTVVALCCPGDSGDLTAEGDHLALSNDGMSEFSNSDLSLPEVCISTNSNTFEEDMNYEVQQAYRIFTGFLLDKHKGITSPFLYPIGHQEAQHGIGGVKGRVQSQLRQSMCLRRMEEKFVSQEYETITEFVADFRLMLENCYRYHGVDHWISKQAQKLEIMLEQKLTLLSRTLREKTTLAVTSKGRFGAEEERGTGGTSTRRRSTPRSLATITVGGHESIMVQTLRLEEQQRAKEEKRQRELEKKEAEEMSAKEVEEWEQSLLSLAFPHTVQTLWELPAIGHFLCLAQTALNLPEIIFFELERCLLMPRCSLLLSKIMSSLLSPPQRRATLHRRPTLPYRRWESELRQRVLGWYRTIGASRDQPGRAEQLGLCHQFFSTLGEVSPLEEKPFHLLPFYQRVWLLKGLCDHVYETQKDVQDAVLAQPIHECRESILGYDSKENTYIHFPHFCGADLRIYRQSPSTPPAFPFPSVWVKKVDFKPGTEDESDGMRDEGNKSDRGCFGVSMDTVETGSPTQGHQRSSCFECCKKKTSSVKSEECGFCCGPSELATQLSSESTQNSTEERANDKIWTKKKKRKKKRGREQLLRVKGEHKQLQHVDRMRLSPAEAAKSTLRKVGTTIKRKDKKKKHKTGEGKKDCLEELRKLIGKTEDELDDLESTKKRLGRWYYRREAVKDLHSTLIRLLNELSPWEPKLVKAHQRNRLRLKKEFDDFKKHPEYSNFEREESNLSSSSSDDDEERDLGKEVPSLSDHYGRSEEEDMENRVPRGLWSGGNSQSSPSSSQQNKQQIEVRGPQQTKAPEQSEVTTVAAVLPKSPQGKPTQTALKNPVQVVYKVPEGLGHLVRKDNNSPIKISVQPVLGQDTGEKTVQQVVILPSNLLVHKTEAKSCSLAQQQTKGFQAIVSKVASSFCMSTDVPGFRIPENRIPVQQVAPLKDARTVKTPSPSVSPRLQHGALNRAGSKETQLCSVQASASHDTTPNTTSITAVSNAVCTEPEKPTDPKQELKTVCIRDSQSILVTTRCGNTGIVKVQTSSDQNTLGSVHTSPVITISPQFKAFLLSKATQSTSAPTQTAPSVVQAMTISQPQQQIHPVLKTPSSLKNTMLTGIPASSLMSQTGCYTSINTAAAQPKGNMIKNDVNIPGSVVSITTPVQTATTVESRPDRTSTLTLDCQRSISEETTSSSSFSSSQFARNKTQLPLSSATTTCTPFTTSATSTIQQRIVINTSTPLAAGTQILLNNARFVVPPQGLAPGSHVLIISSPAQQVPPASPTSTGPSVPSQGASHAMVAPRAPVLPQPPARLPGVTAVSSPFVASTPAVVPPLLATTPNVLSLKLTGTPGLGSNLLPSKTNVVSALPRLPTAHVGNFALPPVGTSTLVSPTARLDSVPTVPVLTSAPCLGSAQGTVRLAATTQAKCLSTISPVVAPPLARLSGPLSLPVVPRPSAVTLPSPVIPVPAPLSSPVAPVIADTPALHGSLPTQHVIAVTTLGIQPQQTAVRFAAPTTAQPQVLMHSGLSNTSIKKQTPLVQTVPAGTRTQVLPTVAVPPIISGVSRMQALPVATVPPIGSTVNTFETATVETTSSSSTTVIITPGQTIPSSKTNTTIHPPVVLTNQTLGKHSVGTSALGLHTSVASKMLISPDGAVLSTVQRPVSSAELTEPRDALVICTNSSTGALQTHDSSLQPSTADTK
uniref:KIAA2026 ortholog n=1 Tax=Pundamilia nyererei TaxID=303518 RepID=A0A3B4FK34_9CICH